MNEELNKELNEMMNALLTRNSASKLTTPAPSEDEISLILKAALRAPDHASLKPWRFIVIKGDRLEALGELLVAAKQAELHAMGEPLLDVSLQTKLKEKPQRAPVIIVPVLDYKDHTKIPEVEQLLSVGCACQNILLAAESLSYGAIWRTGSLAFSDEVAQGLALGKHETALGFIYLGTRDANFQAKIIPQHKLENFVSYF